MKKNCVLFLVIILFSSCHKDVMDRTIFVPDENNGQLPAYSEWGYNSFGAEYERDYFLVSNLIVPCKIMYKDSNLYFSLNGIVRNNQEISLVFIFPFEPIKDYEELIKLNNVEINLASEDCTVKVFQGTNETELNVLSGKLHFKRTQLLSIDEQANRIILSGIFDVRYLDKGLFPESFSNGRFDMGITDNIFYYF